MLDVPTLSISSRAAFKRRDHALTLDAVSLSRGAHALFSGISLLVVNGDVVWIRGDNGIGKSSLLRLMTGLSRVDEGKIHWSQAGKVCLANTIICYQGHQDAFKPSLTALEALEFWTDIMDKDGIDKGLTPVELLAVVGLEDRANVPCGKLSAGQKRRLSLARLILSQKPIWIMDEPTAAMDAEGVNLIHGLIKEHVASGGSAIIASHHAPVISGVRTRQLVLKAAQ